METKTRPFRPPPSLPDLDPRDFPQFKGDNTGDNTNAFERNPNRPFRPPPPSAYNSQPNESYDHSFHRYGGYADPVVMIPGAFFFVSIAILTFMILKTSAIAVLFFISIDILLWIKLYYYIQNKFLKPREGLEQPQQ